MSKDLKDVISTTKEIELNGRTFKVGKLTLLDHAAFSEWCDDQKRKAVIKTYKMMDKELEVEVVINVSTSEQEKEVLSQSIEATIFLLYRVLQKYQEVTYDEVAEMINTDNADDLIKILQVISDGAVEEEETSEKKTVVKSQRKKK